MRGFLIILLVVFVTVSPDQALAFENGRGGDFRENRIKDCRLLMKWEKERLSPKEAAYASQCRWYIRGYIQGAKNFSEGANDPFYGVTSTREMALEDVMGKGGFSPPQMADRNFCFQGYVDDNYDEVAKKLLEYIDRNPEAGSNAFDLLLQKVLVKYYPCE